MSHYSWGMSQSVVEDKIARVMGHIIYYKIEKNFHHLYVSFICAKFGSL